jgi:hypothetical protein
VLCDLEEVALEAERASEPGTSGNRLLRRAMVGALAVADSRAETAIQLFDRAIRTLARAQVRSQLAAGASDAPRSDIPPEAGPRP